MTLPLPAATLHGLDDMQLNLDWMLVNLSRLRGGIGTVTGTGAANPHFTVAHGLNQPPTMYGAFAGKYSTAATAFLNTTISPYQPADNTSLYFEYLGTLANASVYGFAWFAIG